MGIIRRARLFRATIQCLLAGTALLLAAACFSLDVTNPNNLDLSRAYVSPATAEASIVGAWKVDASGKLTDEYKPNPNYRPKAI